MPEIGDEKLLKKTEEENRILVKLAEEKIKKAAQAFKSGQAPQRAFISIPHGGIIWAETVVFSQNKSIIR